MDKAAIPKTSVGRVMVSQFCPKSLFQLTFHTDALNDVAMAFVPMRFDCSSLRQCIGQGGDDAHGHGPLAPMFYRHRMLSTLLSSRLAHGTMALC
jgi:hypothetical protein